MIIDYNKYKRVFAFGCSFTSYIYPTWADIIANEMPNAEYYNFGQGGGGNLFIAARIVEANLRFKFCETDLIMIMYSTSFREDRYIDGRWNTPGNVYQQSYYPKNTFVIPYCHPTGMLIRDLAMIGVSHQYIKSLPCDNFLLKAAPLTEEGTRSSNFNQNETSSVIEIYKDLLNSFPPSMYETEFPNGWEQTIKLIDDNGNSYKDSHPITSRYYSYLQKLGLNLTERSKKYVEDATDKLSRCAVRAVDFPREFPEVVHRRILAEKILF